MSSYLRNIDKITKTKLLTGLRRVHNAARGKDVGYTIDDCYGICGNLNKQPEFDNVAVYPILSKLFMGWDKHSGRKHTPIPGLYSDMWIGVKLARRLDLLKYTIRKLKKMKASELPDMLIAADYEYHQED